MKRTSKIVHRVKRGVYRVLDINSEESLKNDYVNNPLWYPLFIPTIDNFNERLSSIYIDYTQNISTYKVVTKTNQEKSLCIINDLKIEVAKMELGAKKIAINKEGTKDYIETQERIYKRKYAIAKEVTPDINNLLQDEATEFGFTWSDYKALIISKFEAGVQAYELFMSMIERARSKVLFYVETNQVDKANDILTLMKSVEVHTPITDIQETMTTILNYQ